jgi:arylsulfatase A-like enzyme
MNYLVLLQKFIQLHSLPKMISKIIFLLFGVPLGWACNHHSTNSKVAESTTGMADKKPNVIVIVIDDAGYADFGFMGCKDLETPQIDALALDGVVFSDAHVSASVCAPSRAGIMTGKYQQRFGFEANGTGYGDSGDIGLADGVPTLADVFKKYNYKTIAIGKWHLGGSDSDHPNQRGFDEFYGFIGGSRSYFPFDNPTEENMLQYNGQPVNFEGYLTDVLGDKSVSFVEQNKDQHFFMYLSFNAVHTPMEAKESHLEKYKNHPRQYLAAMTWSLDENIGKLRNKLLELNLYDNTLIFFLSDNGGAHNNNSSNAPLKGWKGNKFEGGHRVPFVVSWPSAIAGKQKFGGLTSSLDIFTTSIAAAGIQIEEGMLLDGVNLLPFLKGDKKGNPHEALYWRKLEESAARMGPYKLVHLKGFGSTMYNLSVDLGESFDLAKKDTSMFNRLQKGLLNWKSELTEPLWVEEKPWMEVTYYIQKQLMENKEVKYKSPTE